MLTECGNLARRDACVPRILQRQGRGWVDERALCLSSSNARNSLGHHQNPEESPCHEDKHKAPSRPRIRPLSLQDAGDAGVHYNPIELSKFIRTMADDSII